MRNTRSRAWIGKSGNSYPKRSCSNKEMRSRSDSIQSDRELARRVDAVVCRSSTGEVDGDQMAARTAVRPINRKQSRMWRGRLLRACLVTSAFSAVAMTAPAAQAQANFDRPGGDYQSSMVASGDPADCALVCERDRRCRAWSFNYPTEIAGGALCWLKSNVPAPPPNNCCVWGVRRAGVVSPHTRAEAASI